MIKQLFRLVLLGLTIVLLITFPRNRRILKEFHFEGIALNESQTFKFNKSLLGAADYNLLISIDFRFMQLNQPCYNSGPLLLILIHSSDENYQKRMTIRSTWGLNNREVKTLFFIGKSRSGKINKAIAKESSKFRDVVQGNFIENYYNLTYKHAMALKYTLYHCPEAKYILRVDDDIFVNTPELVDFLKTNISAHGATKCLMCNLNQNPFVVRTYRSKWRISFDDYAGKYYPNYCQGWHVLYSPDVIFELYKELQKCKYFPIDDALVTGILVKKTSYVNHTDTSNFTYIHKSKLKLEDLPKVFLFGGWEIEDRERRLLWNIVSNKRKHRGKSILQDTRKWTLGVQESDK